MSYRYPRNKEESDLESQKKNGKIKLLNEISVSELNDSKKAVYLTTYEILTGVCKLVAPVVPYLSEEISDIVKVYINQIVRYCIDHKLDGYSDKDVIGELLPYLKNIKF